MSESRESWLRRYLDEGFGLDDHYQLDVRQRERSVNRLARLS